MYDRLPEQMAVQIGLDNEANRFANKNFTLFVNPVIMATFQLVLAILMIYRMRKIDKIPVFVKLALLIVPIVSVLMYYVVFMYNLNYSINVGRTTAIAIGILFCLLGNYIPKMNYEDMKDNMNFPPKNEQSFRKQTKILGYGLVLGGIAFFITAFFV